MTTDHGDRGGKVWSTQNVQPPLPPPSPHTHTPRRHHLEEIDAARGRLHDAGAVSRDWRGAGWRERHELGEVSGQTALRKREDGQEGRAQ